MIMDREKADALGLKPLARFRSFAVGGVPPEVMGIGPVEAVPRALKMAGLELSDIGLFPIPPGGPPPTANERTLARGFNPSASAFSLSMIIPAAAPSLVCDEFPAVTEPSAENAGFNVDRTSFVVPGRTPSSAEKVNVRSFSL